MNDLTRRHFLKIALATGVAAGCSPSGYVETAGVTNAQGTALPIPTLDPLLTLSLDLRFVPENQAISYAPSPQGCGQTSISGVVRDAAGQGVPGVLVAVSLNGSLIGTSPVTDANGTYEVLVAYGTTGETYSILLSNPAGTVFYSDTVIAEAIPSCEHNLMTVNFVSTPS